MDRLPFWRPATLVLCTGLHGKACGRRAAKLFQNRTAIFACRSCQGLLYAGQLVRPVFHKLRMAQNVRERLGGSLDIFDPFPPRPRYMHQKTYLRWRRRGIELEATCKSLIADFCEGLDRRVAKKKSR